MEKKRLVGMSVLGILILLPAIMYSLIITKSFWYTIIVIFSITLSYGIFKVKNWARIICIWLALIVWLYFLYLDISIRYIKTLFIILGQAIIYFVPAGILIFYLTHPKVKEQFK